MGVCSKCTSPLRARVHPLEGEEAHFYWEEEGAAFNREGLGVFHRVRKLKKCHAIIKCTSKNTGYAYG